MAGITSDVANDALIVFDNKSYADIDKVRIAVAEDDNQ